jgi:hypothetical protein
MGVLWKGFFSDQLRVMVGYASNNNNICTTYDSFGNKHDHMRGSWKGFFRSIDGKVGETQICDVGTGQLQKKKKNLF